MSASLWDRQHSGTPNNFPKATFFFVVSDIEKRSSGDCREDAGVKHLANYEIRLGVAVQQIGGRSANDIQT